MARDLEQLLREELARLAAETVTAVPLAKRARAARRRRTRVWAGAAVAALVLVAGGIGVASHRLGVESVPGGGTPSSGAGGSPDALLGFRLEVWHDIGVYVPATWGWGGAPGACGAATVGADGHRLSGAELLAGYVGRPVAQTSRCRTTDRGRPMTPYVWLGADVRVGTKDLGDGWVQETREIGGTTVTVGSRDADQRRSILASAQMMAAGACSASLRHPPAADTGPSGQRGGRFVPTAMTVCAYAPPAPSGTSTPTPPPTSSAAPSAASGGSGASYALLYQERLPAGPARQLVDAVGRAKPMGEHSCFAASGGEWALLHLDGADGRSLDYVVDLSCPSIADATGLQHELTSADVQPWAVDGVNAVLHGSPLIDVPGRLIGDPG